MYASIVSLDTCTVMNNHLSNDTPISVSELNLMVKSTLEGTFGAVMVQGEISNVSRPKSGHVYFTLKDSHAEIACAMFKRYLISSAADELISEGNECCVNGLVSLYAQRGQYQLTVTRVRASGEGKLRKEYLALRARLAQQGLFDAAHKKPLVPYPMHIGVISSPAAAGLQDFIVTMGQRYPCCAITVYPAQVQGASAAAELITALTYADKCQHDALLLCRGGGSIEDLWCFNDERLAMCVFNAHTPIISAIGHETDWSICDEVSDLRAATPTQAAMLMAPDQTQMSDKILFYQSLMHQKMADILARRKLQHRLLVKQLRHPNAIINEQKNRLLALKKQLNLAVTRKLDSMYQRLDFSNQKLAHPYIKRRITQQRTEILRQRSNLASVFFKYTQQLRFTQLRLDDKLQQLNPRALMQRGYALITCGDRRIVCAADAEPGQSLLVHMRDGAFHTTVDEK